jgi:hypothetical protein
MFCVDPSETESERLHNSLLTLSTDNSELCKLSRQILQHSDNAILDQRFDRSENSDLSFAELHAAANQQPCSASQPLQGLQTM